MSSVRPELLVGDRYRLGETIAVGGMGEVWRAVDQRLGRPVAVKILKPEYAEEPAFLERFRAEGRHAAMLSHPGIASVFDYGEVDGTAYLVMELVDGEPLSRLLARQGRLPVVQALDVVGQTALALQAAHDAGVVHRDVKPGNLLLRPDGVVKVTDFGIARAVDAVPLTRTGTVLGTAHYLSPEQASGGNVTPLSDVYALGVVAYECLAGRRPFDGDNPFALAQAHVDADPPPLPDDVPGPVRVLVEQALAKEPDRRPESAGVFGRTALALRATMTDELPASPLPVEPPASTRPTPTRPYTRMQPAAAGAVPGGRTRERVRAGATPVTAPPSRPATGRLSALLRRPGSWTPLQARIGFLVAVLAAVVVAGLALRACSEPAASRPHDAARVRVPAGELVGQPVDVAKARLRRLGLDARTVSVDSRSTPGSVAAVRPTGTVPAGSTVTLLVARAPQPSTTRPAGGADRPAPPPEPKKEHGHGHGKDKGGKGGDD